MNAARERPPLLARLRVGPKLMFLVLLPVAGLLAYTVLGALAQQKDSRNLRDLRAATQVSFATADVSDAVARERIAAVLARLRPGPDTLRERAAAEDATDRALERATDRAGSWHGSDVVGTLDAVRRRLRALRPRTGTASLTPQAVTSAYQGPEDSLLDIVTALESGRLTRALGRAADAHVAFLEAIEAAERDRAELAVVLAEPAGRRPATAGHWPVLEEAWLDAFRQTASGELRSALHRTLLQPPGRAVRAVHDALAAPDAKAVDRLSSTQWLTVSKARIDALRGIQDRAAGELADTEDRELRTARTQEGRDLTGSALVLVAVTFLALVLGRSITRPLSEVSKGARALSDGDLSYDIHYTGRDELGAVADTFRELRVTTERLAAEIRAMNTAIDDNRLEHRADVAAFDGTWARLLDGMNDTMASFTAAQGRRENAEHELEGIFNLSLDLLCICGLDGSFKRVNPAFERTLGYPSGTLLSKPLTQFVHKEDRARTRAVLERLAEDLEPGEFENRCIRDDGSECWLQWRTRPVPEQGLLYATARDVTESRRAAREQAALRRVATLVARGVPPPDVFAAVAEEVGRVLSAGAAAVLRYESDGALTVLGAAHTAVADTGATAREVARTRRAVRVDDSVGAPVVVDDRLWGVVVASSLLEPLPAGTESRLADFTELIATAVANADSRAQLRASRARVVVAGDASRRRIERDLHDGVQQRLVSLQLDLRTAESMLEDHSSELAQQLDQVSKGLADAFQDLLQVSRGIHPAILSTGGLGPALRALARRSAVPVELALLLPERRLPEPLEVAAYYVTSECLNNAAKHARATVVYVSAEIVDSVLELTVRDDGVGGAEAGRGSGLIGLTDRVEAIGGRLTVTSAPGQGTVLDVRLPLREPEAQE